MVGDALLAYLHFAAIIGTVGLLAVELAVCTSGASPAELHRLRQLDGFYGMFAMLALVSGAARVLWGAKGSAFYLDNPVFYAKITLFAVAALMSIFPTVQFFRWAKVLGKEPRFLPAEADILRVRRVLKTQLALLAAIPLAATLMARGIG